ncbi:ankyrin repeat domain-containing protein [Paenibacillus ginsengarvi]|uniref:Ankyrin repeat domain-containing protein n=1 Tax=Paenibacillus ginsengarvi TaxID=400777 RepID=A0A3B0CGY5_9BACL|nr:ankyrin repeat domain-containing protein [Paenibacillus ginsengarvi]RKN84410.1 ankyrin repeat domain-containing protein [Paenibacillus ginsengarvi]
MSSISAGDVYRDPLVAKLAEAAAAGDRAGINTLVRLGADVNARGDGGVSLLHWALLHRNTNGLIAILSAGANPALVDDRGRTIMHDAAEHEDPDPLIALLIAGVNPDLRHGSTGQTPLFTAIMYGNERQFRALLSAGADVNAVDMNGNRPLHHAAKVNDAARALVLLELGADPRALNGQGVTFQRYMNMMDDKLRTQAAREAKMRLDMWLYHHGIPLEPRY